MTPKIQSIEERLLEIDQVIINTSHDASEMIKRSVLPSEIDSITGFLFELFKRRNMILWELNKAGGNIKDAYARRNDVEGGTH